jgi:hypothetical protein
LPLEGTDEPFEDAASPILRCGAIRYCAEELWTFTPVRYGSRMGYRVRTRVFGWRTRELGQGHRGEDERWGRKRREIAREVRDAAVRVRKGSSWNRVRLTI